MYYMGLRGLSAGGGAGSVCGVCCWDAVGRERERGAKAAYRCLCMAELQVGRGCGVCARGLRTCRGRDIPGGLQQ